MSEHVTDTDRKTALRVIRELAFVPLGHDMSPAAEVVAAALAAEREKARAPFLALAEEYCAEAFEEHHAGFTTAMDLLVEIRHAAEGGQQ